MADEYERGQAFGPYVLEARLGGGGFGTVWRAREAATGQLVALKILAGKFSAGETGRLRADVELLAAAASAGSEHVVKVLGGGAEPAPHVVMEFIEGSNLEDELERQGKLSQSESLRVLRGLAEALGVLHDAGIIHRDVKPANVMLARDGTVKLTDFGIAKIAGYESVTATGQLPLSAAYAAPEVWAGEATYQSDFYALGAMAFQCLTGARPFAGNFVQLFEMHRNKEPDYALLPGEVVPALRRLIVECLRKEPASRPPDAAALLHLIEEAEGELARPAAPQSTAAAHEPRALGPWLIESRHPTQPWAFRCLHETSGERATVEVHFSDSLELGEQLKRAVAANPSLVPLGAEKLLGTNRLILRPGEAWVDPPAGRFAFWVARQEVPAPIPPGQVSDDEALDYARSALALVGAAASGRITFGPAIATTHFASGGTVHATRVGLPGSGGTTVLEWLRAQLGNVPLLDGVLDDAGLADLVARKAVPTTDAALGVAYAATTAFPSALVEHSTLLSGSALAPPPAYPPSGDVNALESDSVRPEVGPVVPPPSPPGRGRLKWAMWSGGAGAALIGGVAAIWLGLGGGDPPVACDSATQDCETPTPTITAAPSPTPPTATSSVTSTPTVGVTETPIPTSGRGTPTFTPTPTHTPTPPGTTAPSSTPTPQATTTLPSPTQVPDDAILSVDILARDDWHARLRISYTYSGRLGLPAALWVIPNAQTFSWSTPTQIMATAGTVDVDVFPSIRNGLFQCHDRQGSDSTKIIILLTAISNDAGQVQLTWPFAGRWFDSYFVDWYGRSNSTVGPTPCPTSTQ